MASVELQGIRKNFGAVPVIKGVDLKIPHGAFTVFVGPSGCGKSTLLRLIAGLEDITDGTLKIGDRVVNDLPPKDRSIAMVFQSYALFPHMSVYDNIGFGLQLARAPRAEIEAKVREAARILKLDQLLARKPAQLSGGQRQRVAIGRAIVRKPEVFLFDEPLSNLDAALRAETRVEIAKLHRDLGATMIYVTHDQVEAMTLANQIVVLEAGLVRQVGSPMALYSRPANMFVAGFIGSPKMNFMQATVVANAPGAAEVALAGGAALRLKMDLPGVASGDPITVGVRPEHVRADASGLLAGQVEVVERFGAQTLVNVAASTGGVVVAALPGDANVQVGETVRLQPDLTALHVFDATGKAVAHG